ncbi:DUF7537 family lipoprotein [Halorientalis marina]|uniref:DUF7537 family lipoprotein n=1 Tax=Halorientalis marina TaxID=2931976 RepID=UPI001FF21F5A|nr:hypothetical protein [Halorientalis marina]
MRGGILVVALVALLAGCSGFSGGSEATPTLTPGNAPTPTKAYPPGVDDSGVVAPGALAEAHTARDDGRSYTLVSNRTVRYANGTVRSDLSVRIELATNRSFFATVSTDGAHGPLLLGEPPASAAYWSNGSTYARALTRDGGTTYNTFTPPDQYTGTWRYWTQTVAFGGRSGYSGRTIREVFTSIPTEVVGRETRTGTTVVVLAGTAAETTDFTAPEIDTVENLSLRAAVDTEGLVRLVRYRFDGTVDGEPVVVERTIRYEDVGSTSVEKPQWLDRAVGQ